MAEPLLDFSRCRLTPFAHQIVGVKKLITLPFAALFDEMGAGKTKQLIDAAQFLYMMGVIDRVIVVAPASVRTGVWYDNELGELSRHLWLDLPVTISEFHSKIRTRRQGPETKEGEARFKWIITNYEFVRPIDYSKRSTTRAKNQNLVQLLPYCTSKTLLVLDESSAVKNSKAAQTKACMQLRAKCGRIVLLNGTPIANSPGDMFSQGNLMSKSILNCPSYTQFCGRYAIMKPVLGAGGKALTSPRGFVIKTVDKWSGIDDIQKRFAPYVLRRLKKDCIDLPEKLSVVMLTVPMIGPRWTMYKQMRDELVVWLSTCTVSQAPQAMTKIMRLAQLTSGFIGGVEDIDFDNDTLFDEHLAPAPTYIEQFLGPARRQPVAPVQEVGTEKQDAFLTWLEERWLEDPNLKVLVRSRFRPEILRLNEALKTRGNCEVGMIIGGQKREDRAATLRMLEPRTATAGPAVGIMSLGAGAMGLNLAASHTMFTLSNDFSLHHRLQSDDRVHRPGQVAAVSYFDLIATGPQGQKTIDHRVLAALVAKHDLATMTTSGWLDALQQED